MVGTYENLNSDKKRLEFIREKLAYNDKWLLKALVSLYNSQTYEEKANKETKELNGVGFNATDSKILTSLAEQFIEKNWLSDKQIKICRRLIPKYSGQLVNIAKEKTMKIANCNHSCDNQGYCHNCGILMNEDRKRF